MRFLVLIALFIAVAVAAPPCSEVNGKTYCTGLIVPQEANLPCKTVDGQTRCTGLVTPAPEPAKNPCSTVDGKTYCTGFIPAKHE